MKTMMKSLGKKTKKWYGFLLAFVLICSTISVGFAEGNTMAAEESLVQTLGVQKVTAERNTDTRLGQVSSVDAKFTFDLTHPGKTITGGMKINLFSPKKEHVWLGGYLLCVSARTEDKVDFALRNSVDEKLLAYPGEIDVAAGQTMRISAWIENDVLHISVNGVEIITFTNGSSVEGVTYHVQTGVYMGVYNEWSKPADFINVDVNAGDEEDGETTFEELDDTLGVTSVEAKVNTATDLGQLSSSSKGFTFKINHPGADNNGKNIKIGLYNTKRNNCWADGYILNISGKTDSTVDFALRMGNGETLIAYPGTLDVTGDTITISAWLTGNTFHLSMNGTEIMTFVNGTVLDGVSRSVVAGTYLSAYNEWKTVASIQVATEEQEPEDAFDALPDVPSNVTFEDLTKTLGVSAVSVKKQVATNLGRLTTENAGFAFKITRPTPTAGGTIKVGLYNTDTTNPWTDGYILVISGRETDGTVDFAVRKGRDETLLAYPGEFDGFTGEYLTVNTWIMAETFYVGVNGKVIASWKNDGSVSVGTYLSAYSEWKTDVKILALASSGDEEGDGGEDTGNDFSSLPDITQDVLFEDLGMTAQMNSTVIKKHTLTGLGELSGTNVGFKFKMSRPTPKYKGAVKFGLFNTEPANPWKDGYILVVSSRDADGIIDFAVRKGSDETLIAYAGEFDGFKGQEIEVYAWISAKTFYVGVNGKVIASWKNDGSVKVGTYLSAYNEFAVNPTVKTFREVDDDPLAIYPNVPKNIKFEDIGKTKQKNKIEAAKSVVTPLGELSSKKVGFRFKLNVPKANDTSESIKIGLYNTEEYNPWTNGYLLIVSTRPKQGTLDFAIRKGSDETLIAYPGEFAGFEKDVVISVWIKKRVFYLAVNDKVIASWGNDGSVKTGTYLAAYNEWSKPAVIKTIKKVDENANLVPDTRGGIDFMDIGQSARKNKIEIPNAQVTTLGQLKSVKNGFKFKVTPPDQSQLLSLKLGLYNTEMNNPWTDGYLLIFTGTETKGVVSVCLRKGKDEMLIALPDSLVDITKDIEVETWITDVNASNGAHTFHARINGKEIITYKNEDGSVLIGPHLAAYNDNKKAMTIKTYTVVDENAFPAPPDTSGDIDFDDLGKTMKANVINCAHRVTANLGSVSSIKKGFIFKMTTPTVVDMGETIKIGLYNLEKKNPWTDGYILCITPRAEKGVLDFALRKGKDETLLCYPGEFSGFEEDTITIKAWITDTDARGNAHTMHVSINGVEYLTYTNEDGSVQVGKFMSAYNNSELPLSFYTIEEVLEPSDRYLMKFGDPTAIDGVCRVEQEVQTQENSVKEEGNFSNHYIAWIAIVVGTLTLVGLLILLQKKKKGNGEKNV